MGLDDAADPGQTLLEDEERDDLKIPTISTRGELDEFEHLNIQRAVAWAEGQVLSRETLLSEECILDLHRRMFGEVWKWVGSFRTTNKNLGVDKFEIPVELRKLLDDARTVYLAALRAADAGDIGPLVRFARS
ncbi:MAG: hypothetical protein A3H45_09060 [Ignavibacteria bacterium RIFCSPLOWO2_02_FULL_55_14]|nr:MAG: hypothetical protein A3H45_09060 [Ignavibacteria bacterium RIFCSPLOWO2_02_FULL_55_14]